MESTQYVEMDVHTETISVAVVNSLGKVVMESILETKASTLLQFIRGLRGKVRVAFEEGTWAAWLHDLLKPHVTPEVVCNPRQNALLKSGNQSAKIDARKLAELLRAERLSPVYHGEMGLRNLRELSRSYLTVSRDLTRVMNRLKALYPSWGKARRKRGAAWGRVARLFFYELTVSQSAGSVGKRGEQPSKQPSAICEAGDLLEGLAGRRYRPSTARSPPSRPFPWPALLGDPRASWLGKKRPKLGITFSRTKSYVSMKPSTPRRNPFPLASKT
jgi:hypothetical protein